MLRPLLYLSLLVASLPALAVSCPAGNVLSTPTADFTANGDGTVTHSKTGLIWQRCQVGKTWDGSTCTGSATAMNWSTALQAAASSTVASHSDWRLPNIKELRSLVESGCSSPSINTTLFPNDAVNSVWSSTTMAGSADSAWRVEFVEGFHGAATKVSSYYVRLVRGGELLGAFDRQSSFAPNAYSFTSQNGVTASTVVTSAGTTLAGLTTPTGIQVSGGSYAVNGGAYTTAPGVVNNGDVITLRHPASAAASTTVTTSVTIGGVASSFASTTAAETTPPTLTAVGVSGTSGSGATLSATSDETATGYWVVLPAAATAPNATQVKAGQDASNAAASFAGNAAMTASVVKSFTLSGLTASTAYKVYFVARDTVGNDTAVQTVSFSTTAVPAGNVLSTPTADFTDNGDGTVTHSKTGLTWQRCQVGQTWNGSTCTGSATAMSWSAALQAAASSTVASHSDWRLPNIKELRSLAERGSSSPSINTTLFPNAVVNSVWSSTTMAGTADSAWRVEFVEGFHGAATKVSSYYVRLVRGGELLGAFDRQSSFAPNAYSFTSQNGVTASTVVTSAGATLAGLSTPTGIQVSGGSYAVNGGTYTTAPGVVNNGDVITLRHTASAAPSTTVTTNVTIGGVASSFASTTAAATVPGAPTGVSASAGNGQATVSFTAPASNGGSAILGYTVISSPAGGVDAQADSTATSHTVTGLSNGTAYTFTVVARNALGNSVASTASSAVTPVAPPPVEELLQTTELLNTRNGVQTGLVVRGGPFVIGAEHVNTYMKIEPSRPVSITFNGSTLATLGVGGIVELRVNKVIVNGKTELALQILRGSVSLAATQVGQVLVAVGGAPVVTAKVGTKITVSSTQLAITQGSVTLPGNAFAAGQDTTLYAGEVAELDAQGKISRIRLGSADGSGELAGDPLLPTASGLTVSAAIPRLSGTVARLPDGLEKAVASALGGSGTQNASGTLVLSGDPSQFWLPVGEVLIDSTQADGRQRSSDGLTRVARQGVVVTLAPAPRDLVQFAADLRQAIPEMTLTLREGGALVAQLGTDKYVVRPAEVVNALASETNAARFSTSSAGELRYQDASGSQQVLHPAFLDYAGTLTLLRRLGATASVNGDGSIAAEFGQTRFTLTPDITLAAMDGATFPHVMRGDKWWVDEAGKVFLNLGGGVQGVGVK